MQRRLVGIPGFCMDISAQLGLLSAFPHSAKIPPANRLQSSPADVIPEDESFTALGAQWYHLFILPGLWDRKHLFYPTTNFRWQKVTPTDQDWIAVWRCRSLHTGCKSGRSLSHLVLFCYINFQEQKWLDHFEKKIIKACEAFSHHSSHASSCLFKRNRQSRLSITGAARREREPCFLETAKA